MARQQTKQKKTENIRLPFIGSMTNRSSSATKDQRFINIFPETRKVEQIESTKVFMNKRPGLSVYKDFGTGEGRGCIYWNNKFYVAIGNTLYEDGVSPTSKITFSGSTGHVGMIASDSSTIGDYLFICDGTGGWYINTSGTVTSITDADFPSGHIPIPVAIDGYIILAKGSELYNCDLDTPANWTASNFVSAEMFPDPLRALARQNNQVVALGSTSMEFFYDAANATGSPLTRNESTANQMGIAAPNALYQNEKFLLFVGQSESGGRTVWKVEGFQPTRISDEFIDRVLDSETSITTVSGFGLRTMGHMFFVINLPNANRTLVYDLDEKLWHEWSSNVGDAHAVFNCNHACDNGSGSIYVLHSSNGTLYKLDTTIYMDDTTPIITEIVTNRFDMDTIKRKFMSNIRWVGDMYETNSIDLRWTDDDYRTWSNWKTIDLADDFPNFARMGSFRRRAFDWRHTGNYPLRGESFEVTFQEGDS